MCVGSGGDRDIAKLIGRRLDHDGTVSEYNDAVMAKFCSLGGNNEEA
jgi:hypothetical protein